MASENITIHEDEYKNVTLLNAYTEAEMTQFEEVGGTCSNKDNPDEACCTVRSVVIGLVFVLGMSYLHQWTNFQLTGTFISSALTVVLVYPFGILWAKVVPYAKPFTLKEHGFIMIMTNVAWMYYSTFTYATLSTLKVLELDNLNFAYYFGFVLSIQFLGFGLAGKT
ncbi:unnamed protein product [Adineta steineri]|uniref:Uncharacterized protein n=1 Tax=Adineta steineri TaxID=433720 RepID=A0A813Y3H1_9BILA|nr:unnamed protein product [Adineta steineri]CAF0896088.1 unnamed protein product [Adineta steineri]CAF0960807.1 unnamed protein product [Adineta steineri]CAF3826466.1 unnamed protein product [Adineta steineri]CAF3897549.1 unnamed protein product [Adineta steineri]